MTIDITADTTAVPSTTPATVDTSALVGNPRRTRGLNAAVLRQRQATSALVGNPRRLRRLDAACFDTA
jgi:hypothetical protein